MYRCSSAASIATQLSFDTLRHGHKFTAAEQEKPHASTLHTPSHQRHFNFHQHTNCPGKVAFSALDETFSTYIRPMEQWVGVQYQKNYAGLGVNTKAFLFTQETELGFEISGISSIDVEGTKDTVKSTTPTICSVSRTESPRDFSIKGLKVGQCVIQYSNAGVAEYPPINKLITIKVEKLSAITPANGKILRFPHNCARNNYKERIQEMVLTPRLTCPKTYSDWP